MPHPPPEALPCIAIRNRVLFPGSFVRLFIGRERSVALVKARLWDAKKGALRKDAPLLGVFTRLLEPEMEAAATATTATSEEGQRQEENEEEEKKEGAVSSTAAAAAAAAVAAAAVTTTPLQRADPGPGPPFVEERDVYAVGVAARVTELKRAGKDANYAFTLVVEGVRRVRMLPAAVPVPANANANAKAKAKANANAANAPNAAASSGGGGGDFLVAHVAAVADEGDAASVAVKALSLSLQEQTRGLLDTLKERKKEGRGKDGGGTLLAKTKDFLEALAKRSPGDLADVLVANLDVRPPTTRDYSRYLLIPVLSRSSTYSPPPPPTSPLLVLFPTHLPLLVVMAWPSRCRCWRSSVCWRRYATRRVSRWPSRWCASSWTCWRCRGRSTRAWRAS